MSKQQKLMKTMQCLLLVFILSGCKGALIGDLVAQPGQALYHDDFSDPGSGWPQATSAKGILGYDQGAYRMQVLSPGYDLRAVSGQFFSDVQIEVDTTRVSGPVYNQFGVTCRFQDLNNFYFFVISSDGYYAHWKDQRWGHHPAGAGDDGIHQHYPAGERAQPFTLRLHPEIAERLCKRAG